MTHNWEDQFDFMSSAEKKKLKKDDPKKSKQNIYTNNEFQDLENDDKGVKLPSLNSKPAYNNTEKPAKNAQKVNLQEITQKKAIGGIKNKAYEDEQLEEIYEQSVAPYITPLKQKAQEVEQKKKVNTQILKQKQITKEDIYEQQQNLPEENYRDDFQVHQQKQPSPIIFKGKEQKDDPKKSNINPVNVPKPVPKDRKGAESVAKKIDNSARMNSRNSARSQDRSVHSKTRVQERKQEGPNKFTSVAQKNCPDYDKKTLEQFGMDKLVRENQRIRTTIKKFNDELNDMINRNIMLLKGKKQEKVVVQDDVIKQLQEQKANKQTVYQTTIRDLEKLKDKEGSLKGEEYQLNIDQQILETKNSITEFSKNITKLNFDIANEGNKLTKIDKEKNTSTNVEVSNIKTGIINARKEEEKNDQISKKLDSKLEELTKKMAEIQVKINEHIEDAKQKGISLVINPDLVKKLQELKKKIDIGKQHKGKTEALFKTKCEMIVHQIDQIKTQIKHIQNSHSTCQSNCEQIQGESRKVVQRAKKGGKISSQLVLGLENIINQMQRGVPSGKQGSEQQGSLSQPKGAKKYQSLKNVQKINPIPAVAKEAQKTQDDSNIKKPLLFKKKKDQQQKIDERVWKQQKKMSPPKIQKTKESSAELAKFEDKQVQKKDEEKKKPFVFKKSKQRPSEQQIEPPKQDIPQMKKQEVKKQQPQNQVPNLAPRMMKFKRNKEDPQRQEAKPIQINDKNADIVIPKEVPVNNSIKIQQKPQEEENPTFAPRRFNLKLKDRKSEEGGYVASNIQKKQQPKIQEPKEKGLSINIEKQQTTISKPIEQPKIQMEQQKPKFNLKLRDRQRESNKQQIKVQEKNESIKQHIQQVTAKIAINLSDNPVPLKQNSNPYAQQQQIAKRERQGPLKKAKPVQTIPKQQFNIYEQAQDLTNVKELKIQEPKPAQKYNSASQELDLNKMLGLNKPKKTIQDDLLVDSKLIGKKKQAKKDTNFFGDLQL